MSESDLSRIWFTGEREQNISWAFALAVSDWEERTSTKRNIELSVTPLRFVHMLWPESDLTKKKTAEPGPNGLSVSGPVGSRRTCRALQCWSSEPGRLLLKQKGLQGRDIQVVKPYKCGCRGPAGRLTNVWNGHHAVPCPGRGDAPCEMGSDSDGALQPKEEYANVIASTNHLDILCFVTGPPLMQLPKPSKICSDFLYEAERSMHTFRPWFLAVHQGGGSTESDMTWVHNPALVSGRPRSR